MYFIFLIFCLIYQILPDHYVFHIYFILSIIILTFIYDLSINILTINHTKNIIDTVTLLFKTQIITNITNIDFEYLVIFNLLFLSVIRGVTYYCTF